ncbi:MAG: hypothetical protein RR365_14935 [Bacteroides sp.]
METLLLSILMHPKLWLYLGNAVLSAGGAIAVLAWRLGKLEGRAERRIHRFNIDIELSIAMNRPGF